MGKIRISLFKPDSPIPEEDRLVQSTTEFTVGPKEKWEGPIAIEYLMHDAEDVNGLIKYLSQLALDMPISEREKKTTERKTQSLSILAEEPLLELTKQAFQKNKSQEELITYLRALNFVFVTEEHLRDIHAKQGTPWKLKTKKGTKKKLHDNYQFMVRQLKLAKDPKNDKYDTQLAFGIKLTGDRYPKVQVYLYGEFSETKELHWAQAPEINFKVKEKFYKFNEAMTYEDRAKWRMEDRKLQENPELEPSKFWTRWQPYVNVLKQQPKKAPKA